MENTNSCKEIKRSKNFTEKEISLLLTLVVDKKDIIECKRTDNVTVKDKELAWKVLTEEFNENSGYVARDWKTLKGKYENLKKTTKKKFAVEKQYLIGTGGGPSHSTLITSTELKVKELLGDIQIRGLQSQFDADSIYTPSSVPNLQTDDTGHMAVDFSLPVVDDLSAAVDHSYSSESEEVVTEPLEVINVNMSELEQNIIPAEIVPAEKEVGGKRNTMPRDVLREEIRPTQRSNQFSVKNLRRAPSTPLRLKKNNRYKQSSLDDTLAGKKLQCLSKEKQELLKLQREVLEEEIKFKRAEHEIKIKNMQEEHDIKMKLFELDIKNKELDLELKRHQLVHLTQ